MILNNDSSWPNKKGFFESSKMKMFAYMKACKRKYGVKGSALFESSQYHNFLKKTLNLSSPQWLKNERKSGGTKINNSGLRIEFASITNET